MNWISFLFDLCRMSWPTVAKKISLFNKDLVYLIYNIYWLMGFQIEMQAEKV